MLKTKKKIKIIQKKENMKKDKFQNKERRQEEKTLLFMSGILFGIGVTTALLDILWFTSFILLALAVVLIFLASYHKQR